MDPFRMHSEEKGDAKDEACGWVELVHRVCMEKCYTHEETRFFLFGFQSLTTPNDLCMIVERTLEVVSRRADDEVKDAVECVVVFFTTWVTSEAFRDLDSHLLPAISHVLEMCQTLGHKTGSALSSSTSLSDGDLTSRTVAIKNIQACCLRPALSLFLLPLIRLPSLDSPFSCSLSLFSGYFPSLSDRFLSHPSRGSFHCVVQGLKLKFMRGNGLEKMEVGMRSMQKTWKGGGLPDPASLLGKKVTSSLSLSLPSHSLSLSLLLSSLSLSLSSLLLFFSFVFCHPTSILHHTLFSLPSLPFSFSLISFPPFLQSFSLFSLFSRSLLGHFHCSGGGVDIVCVVCRLCASAQ